MIEKRIKMIFIMIIEIVIVIECHHATPGNRYPATSAIDAKNSEPSARSNRITVFPHGVAATPRIRSASPVRLNKSLPPQVIWRQTRIKVFLGLNKPTKHLPVTQGQIESTYQCAMPSRSMRLQSPPMRILCAARKAMPNW
jgi:hypothetical protein